MAKIIGREKEIQTLAEAMKSERSEFVAVYGRRRIGKTFLIKEYFNNKFSFLFVGTRGISKATQLDNFALALQRQFAIDFKPALQNWFDAFHLLEDLLTKKRTKGKRVVFIDEMPWMDSPKSDFVPALELFWNGWANMRDDIVLIACGSATSWMVDKVFHNRGGLFNRITRHLYLKPFTLNEVEKLLHSQGIQWDRYQIAQCYMALGGVPFYLTLLNRSESLSQNIDRLFFSSENAPLRMEYSELYSALFKDPEKYMTIVKALSAKRDGMTRNELIEQCGFGGSSITKVLSDLERCDFIFGYSQFGNKTKNTLYRIKDFYTLFYYKFVEKDDGKDNCRWSHILQSQQVRIWQGFSFELLCLLHLDQIKNSFNMPCVKKYR
ncbi:MAG: ATP-binding protein [Prevotella sp.]|nr:ATP-binding protein [Prevotella sp.]